MSGEKNKKNNKKIFVALSGGVDSSVATFLLKEQGYDVTGVFIKVWHPNFIKCDWKIERDSAMRVCAKLEIPFLMFDFEKEYKEEVVDYMISEYTSGRTPNPDVMCNKNIKFGAFLDKALEMGAEMIATGHYARLKREITNHKSQNPKLLAGVDKGKDQSYFLWTLTQNQLSKTLFPIGHLEKTEVRKIAKKAGLDTATKKDSQGLCFIGKINMKEFLKKFIDVKKGSVLDKNGKVIGTHQGALLYTIGQRRGFIITKKTSEEKPYYVVSKDIKANTLVVDNILDNSSLVFNSNKIILEKINWISGEEPELDKVYLGRIRYRQLLQKCKISKGLHSVSVIFEKRQKAIALGQSVVIYDGEVCLGGGVVKEINTI